LNFLHFQDVPAARLSSELSLRGALGFFESHPGTLAALSFAVLVLALVSLVVTNWSRIMLVLMTNSIIGVRVPEMPEQWVKSRQALMPVIRMSLLTAALMVLVAAFLFVPPFFVVSNPKLLTILLAGATVVFVPLAFTISCINIFSSFYIVLFKKPLWIALNLGTDMVVSRWGQILPLALVLMVIYCVCFVVGLSLITITHSFLSLLLGFLLQFNIFAVSAMIIALRILSAAILWLLLAGLNVFINTALLLLFLQLITPIIDEGRKEAEKRTVLTNLA